MKELLGGGGVIWRRWMCNIFNLKETAYENTELIRLTHVRDQWRDLGNMRIIVGFY